jgi:hypothetical protein
MFRIEPQIQRQERKAEALVLLHVPDLVFPERVGRLAREHEDVSQRDRGVAAAGEDEMREAAVGYVEEATVAETRTSEREPTQSVPDRVGMVRDQLAREVTAACAIIARCYRRPPAPPPSRGRRSLRADRIAAQACSPSVAR